MSGASEHAVAKQSKPAPGSTLKPWLWPLGTLVLAAVGGLSLRALWLDAFGPEATDPHARHLGAAYLWLALFGFSSVFMGLATTWHLLRRAHLVLAGLTIGLLALPVTVLGLFSLYLLGACLGVV